MPVAEDVKAEEGLAQIEPEQLDRVQLRTVVRKRDEGDVRRDVEGFLAVSSGAVENHEVTNDRYRLRRDTHNCFSVVEAVSGRPVKLGVSDLSELLSSEASEMIKFMNKLDQFRWRYRTILESI